jgi:hypothetical protein
MRVRETVLEIVKREALGTSRDGSQSVVDYFEVWSCLFLYRSTAFYIWEVVYYFCGFRPVNISLIAGQKVFWKVGSISIELL